jgi:hypothetical protein
LLQIFTKAACPVIKELWKAASTRIQRFLKAAGNCMKRSAKKIQNQRLLENPLYGQEWFLISFITAPAAFRKLETIKN